ncbi:MAG TPA: hypothetical protein VGP55_03045, partial [Chitinophagaceae bacterium]|nr:hypothetical protein [Chitinophagaceae bacterium]
MSLEPVLAFFLIRHLRKNLRTFSPDAWWDKIFTYSMYGVIFLVILQQILSLTFVTMWVWHMLLLGIVYISFSLPLFSRVRTVMIAVLPLIVLSLSSDIIKSVNHNLHKNLETYINIAFAIAITWMVAMLI